jgi:hypothetical protein
LVAVPIDHACHTHIARCRRPGQAVFAHRHGEIDSGQGSDQLGELGIAFPGRFGHSSSERVPGIRAHQILEIHGVQ